MSTEEIRESIAKYEKDLANYREQLNAWHNLKVGPRAHLQDGAIITIDYELERLERCVRIYEWLLDGFQRALQKRETLETRESL